MFLGPVLEYHFEIRADFIRLFKDFLGLFVKVELHTVADNHEVQNEALVLWLIVGVADYIFNELEIVCDKFLFDVPVGFLDHVGKENDFDFVEQKDFTDGFEDFEDGVLGSVLA